MAMHRDGLAWQILSRVMFVGQAVFFFISRLWLICCERKTLFHG
jgi:hypothetical protein